MVSEFCYFLESIFQFVNLKFLFLRTFQGQARDKRREVKALQVKLKKTCKAYNSLKQKTQRAESEWLRLALRSDAFEQYRRKVTEELEGLLLLISEHEAAILEVQAEIDAETQRQDRRMAVIVRTTGIVIALGIKIAHNIFKSA